MTDNLARLQQRVDEVLSLVGELKRTNAALQKENTRLKTELARLQQEVSRLQAGQNDQSEVIKAKLNAVLAQIDELENLAG